MAFEGSTSLEKWLTHKLKQADASAIQSTQNSIEYGHRLKQVHDVLDVLDLPDEQEEEYKAFLLWQDESFLEVALSKPASERLQFLMQAQVDTLKAKGLKNLSTIERVKYSQLNKRLLATEGQELKQEQGELSAENTEIDQNSRAIVAENNEQEQRRLKQDEKIAALKHTLLENPAIAGNANIGAIKSLFTELDTVDRTNETGKRAILQRIINQLKSPWTLESIAHDLGGTETQAYQEFKAQLLTIEPDLQSHFEKAEINLADSLAKIKLGTNTLDGVKAEGDKLIQTAGDFVIEAGKNERHLSHAGSQFKLSSKLDPTYEYQLWQVGREANQALVPINDQLDELSSVIEYVEQAKDHGENFAEIKSQLKTNHPEIYNESWLESSESFDAILLALGKQKADLDKVKNTITDKAKAKLDTLVARSTTAAMEQDKPIEELLSFFHTIGFDAIDQNKLNIIIAMVNRNPHLYGLQHPMDFTQWSLGFDHDYGANAISTLEKQSFIQFFNQMLWEPVVDEAIALWTIALNWRARMRLQVLSNKPVEFFMANLKQQHG